MRHYKNWKSIEAKLNAWRELCDLSANLMLAGIKLNIKDETLAKKEFYHRLNNVRQKNRFITQQALAKTLK